MIDLDGDNECFGRVIVEEMIEAPKYVFELRGGIEQEIRCGGRA